MNKKRITGAALASALIFAPLTAQTVTAMADSFYTQQTNAERADITNWVANSSQEISNNISAQHIDTNNLDGDQYVIQWGDTLSGISAATGISVGKLAYDNNIHNIDLIYAGDVLILNRDGEVPTNWHYYGDGVYVAKTKVTINNYIDNSDDHSINISVSPVSTRDPKGDDDDDYKADDNDTDKDDDTDTDESSSSTSSSKDNKASTKASSSKEDADVLDDDEFSDAVKDEVADKLDFDDDEADEKLAIDFTGKDDDDVDTEDESSSEDDVDTDDEDVNTEDVYDEDQDVSTGSDKLTEKNAKKLADKIFKQLKDDKKIEDIKSADDIEFTITADDDDFKFNITLTTEDDSDADSDSESVDDDVDAESSSEDDVDSSSDDESSSASSDESSEVTAPEDEANTEE